MPEETERVAKLEMLGERNRSDIEALEKKVDALDCKFTELLVNFNVLKTQIGMYAAGGAVIGGGAVSIFIAIVMKALNI